MSKPSNPFEIVLKNKFFPDGLTEHDIYLYWMKNKDILLSYLRNKKSLLYLMDKKQNIVVRRYITSGDVIKLTYANFDKIINGRIIGIFEIFDVKSIYGIIDIDSPKENNIISSESSFDLVKELTLSVFNEMSKLHDCSVIYSGKNGFHIRVNFEKLMFIDKIKKVLSEQIKSSPNLNDFFKKRNENYPNIDLSPNMKNGAVIIPFSLNKIGLPATEVRSNRILDFSRENLIKMVILRK